MLPSHFSAVKAPPEIIIDILSTRPANPLNRSHKLPVLVSRTPRGKPDNTYRTKRRHHDVKNEGDAVADVTGFKGIPSFNIFPKLVIVAIYSRFSGMRHKFSLNTLPSDAYGQAAQKKADRSFLSGRDFSLHFPWLVFRECSLWGEFWDTWTRHTLRM